MALNIEANRKGLIHHFPRLKDDETFTIESPETSGYNCIAWAMGFDDRWVDYIDDHSPKKWWPSGVARVDVRHRSGDIFTGTSYGEVYQIMRRSQDKRSIIETIKQEEPRMLIPENIIAMIASMMA